MTKEMTQEDFLGLKDMSFSTEMAYHILSTTKEG